MKKKIKANNANYYDEHFVQNHGNHRFSIYIKNGDSPFFEASISEIHPYDLAEYTWAKILRNGQIEYRRNSKIIEKMQLWDYDEEYYESIDDYINDCIDSVMVDIIEHDKDVESRIDRT